jgi:hypothetical protein
LGSAVPGWTVEIALGAVSLVFSLQQIKGQFGNWSPRPPAHP